MFHVDHKLDPWSPITLAKLNDSELRLANFHGSFHWHKHEADELFFVVKGEIVIETREQPIILQEGQGVVIKAGIEHMPTAKEPTQVLMFEKADVDFRGK